MKQKVCIHRGGITLPYFSRAGRMFEHCFFVFRSLEAMTSAREGDKARGLGLGFSGCHWVVG
jgi:hypothetical protein